MTVRKWLLAAAAGAALTPAAAAAATIVATDNELVMKGIAGFDTSLGTLNKVTLDVNVTKYRAWQLRLPNGAAPSMTGASVDWAVNGTWELAGFGLSAPLLVALTGTGTSPVNLMSGGGFDFGFFEVMGSGSASVTLDPSFFTDRSAIYFNGFDRGFLAPPAGDTTLSGIPAGGSAIHLSRSCGVIGGSPVPATDDSCGAVNYTLTYDYTPVGAAVPEPATWAMMVLGFALAGAAIRRRGAAVARATA